MVLLVGWGLATLKCVTQQFVRCPQCGQPHVAVSATDAQRSVSQFNAASERGGWEQVATFERYLRCSKCSADSRQFVPTVLSQWEQGQTIQAVVVKRET